MPLAVFLQSKTQMVGFLGLGFFELALIVAVSSAVYFLPTFIAVKRNHSNRTPIMLTNIFFGWTVVGWVVALIWAFSDNSRKA